MSCCWTSLLVLLVLTAQVHGEYECSSIDYWGRKVLWEGYIQCRNKTDLARCRQVEYVYYGTARVNMDQDLNQPDSRNNWTMLMTASHEGHHKVVKMLLDNGALEGINMQDRCGWSALMFAAFTGFSTEVVELLLKHGADTDLVNRDGRTALFMASAKGHVGIVELLLKSGANPNYIDKWEKSALTVGVYGQQGCHPDVVRVFLQNLETTYLKDHLNPVLWVAAEHCCPMIVKDILCSKVQIQDFDKICKYTDKNWSTTADPECENCSCLKVKTHLLMYKTDSMHCNYQQDIIPDIPTTDATIVVLVIATIANLVIATIVSLVVLCLIFRTCKQQNKNKPPLPEDEEFLENNPPLPAHNEFLKQLIREVTRCTTSWELIAIHLDIHPAEVEQIARSNNHNIPDCFRAIFRIWQSGNAPF